MSEKKLDPIAAVPSPSTEVSDIYAGNKQEIIDGLNSVPYGFIEPTPGLFADATPTGDVPVVTDPDTDTDGSVDGDNDGEDEDQLGDDETDAGE